MVLGMSSGDEPSREVHVDVLPPVPKDAYAPTPLHQDRAPFEGLNTFYHPASGVVILALDWLIFGTDLLTDFLALPAMCVLGFIATFPLVYLIQQKWSKDTIPNALGKAFLGAFMVGLPFPITGTLLGAAILALSGLPHHPVEAVKRLVSRATAK
jgi:hypothetical protein